MQTLLSCTLLRRTNITGNIHDQMVLLTGFHERRQVHTERGTAAEMAHHELTVKINFRIIIYGSEIKHNIFALPSGRNIQYAMIPLMRNKISIADSRKFAFGTERHRNFPFERDRFFVSPLDTRSDQIEDVIPCTVKINPTRPFELRSRIFRTRNHRQCRCS